MANWKEPPGLCASWLPGASVVGVLLMGGGAEHGDGWIKGWSCVN